MWLFVYCFVDTCVLLIFVRYYVLSIMENIFTGYGGHQSTQGEFISGGADIFSSTPIEKSTKYSRESVHRPQSENVDGPFEFHMPAEGDTYIDTDSYRLSGYTKLTINKPGSGFVNLTATTEADDKEVAPISFLPGMAFQTKEVSINGQLVNYATQPLDNLKSYIENLLSYGSDAKNTVLQTCNWIPDDPGTAERMALLGKRAEISGLCQS